VPESDVPVLIVVDQIRASTTLKTLPDGGDGEVFVAGSCIFDDKGPIRNMGAIDYRILVQRSRRVRRSAAQRQPVRVVVQAAYLVGGRWLFEVRPKIRSLRIGSRPFQSARAKHSRPKTSEMPAKPSSPQR